MFVKIRTVHEHVSIKSLMFGKVTQNNTNEFISDNSNLIFIRKGNHQETFFMSNMLFKVIFIKVVRQA